jgi:hypothetical protein
MKTLRWAAIILGFAVCAIIAAAWSNHARVQRNAATYPSVASACLRMTDTLRSRDPNSTVVASLTCDGVPGDDFSVTCIMRDDAWVVMTHDTRLKLATSMQSAAAHFSGLDENADKARIKLVGEAGESLGGSGFAGSAVSVQGGAQ